MLTKGSIGLAAGEPKPRLPFDAALADDEIRRTATRIVAAERRRASQRPPPIDQLKLSILTALDQSGSR